MPAIPLLVDAHEDLAWNMLTFGRDYTRPAAETRRREAGGLAPQVNGDTLLGWPDYQRARAGLVFATLFAAPLRRQSGPWDTQVYADASSARRAYRAQLDAYLRLVDEHPDKFRLVAGRSELGAVLQPWQAEDWALPAAERQAEGEEQERDDPAAAPTGHPVGLVLLMEGAEAITDPPELEEWWAAGLRYIGPAWSGNRFCGGTGEPGPLTPDGFELLETMAALGFGLDLSHMDEKAAFMALDAYSGQVIASHANAQALLRGIDTNRHLSDRLIAALVEHDAVIGVVPYNVFLQAGWRKGDRRALVSLDHLAAQVDHICQIAGDADHVGLGSDFDGGFGLQQTPVELDTIADLQRLAALLEAKGYGETEIAAVFGQNWIRKLKELLP